MRALNRSLRNLLGVARLACGLLAIPSCAVSPPAKMPLPLVSDGEIVGLSCLGTDPNPSYVWLNGMPDGTVNLAPSTAATYPGTHWRVHQSAPGVYALECLSSPDLPWLNGRTAVGTIDLAPSTDGIYTGTQWEIDELSPGVYALQCLGDKFNPNYLWLDGVTTDGSLDLAPSTDSDYSGTHWSIQPLK
jgi:hypothetical protein